MSICNHARPTQCTQVAAAPTVGSHYPSSRRRRPIPEPLAVFRAVRDIPRSRPHHPTDAPLVTNTPCRSADGSAVVPQYKRPSLPPIHCCMASEVTQFTSWPAAIITDWPEGLLSHPADQYSDLFIYQRRFEYERYQHGDWKVLEFI
jgi:hypothetical protein